MDNTERIILATTQQEEQDRTLLRSGVVALLIEAAKAQACKDSRVHAIMVLHDMVVIGPFPARAEQNGYEIIALVNQHGSVWEFPKYLGTEEKWNINMSLQVSN